MNIDFCRPWKLQPPNYSQKNNCNERKAEVLSFCPVSALTMSTGLSTLICTTHEENKNYTIHTSFLEICVGGGSLISSTYKCICSMYTCNMYKIAKMCKMLSPF